MLQQIQDLSPTPRRSNHPIIKEIKTGGAESKHQNRGDAKALAIREGKD